MKKLKKFINPNYKININKLSNNIKTLIVIVLIMLFLKMICQLFHQPLFNLNQKIVDSLKCVQKLRIFNFLIKDNKSPGLNFKTLMELEIQQ